MYVLIYISYSILLIYIEICSYFIIIIIIITFTAWRQLTDDCMLAHVKMLKSLKETLIKKLGRERIKTG